MTWRIFWTLFKLSSAVRTTRKKQSKTPRILYMLFIAVAMCPFMFFLYHSFDGMYLALAKVHAEGALIGVATVGAQFLAFIFGIMIVMTSIFMTQDLESLFTLPIRPSVVMSARLLYFWFSDLMTLAIFVLPAFAVYGVHTHSAAVWVELIVLFLFLPIVPLLLAFALCTGFMRVTNVGRIRDKLRYVGAFLGIGMYILFQTVIRGHFMSSMNNGSAMQSMLTGPHGILSNIGTYFPPSLWATYAILLPPLQGGLRNLAYIVLLTVVLALIGMWFAEHVFLSSYLGSFDGSRKKKRVHETRLSHQQGVAHLPVRALFMKEFHTFFRSPTFFMNAVASMIVTTFAVLFPVLSHRQEVLTSVGSGAQGTIVSLIGAAVIFFLGTMNSVAGSSTSREGTNFFFLKTLPVTAKDYVMVKWWFANLFAGVASVIVIASEFLVFHIHPVEALVSFVLGALPCLSYNAVSLMIDMSFPKLDWTNEQVVMKGMKNFILLMGEMVICGLLAGLVAVLHFLAHMPFGAIVVLFVILLAAIAALFISLMRMNAAKMLSSIE